MKRSSGMTLTRRHVLQIKVRSRAALRSRARTHTHAHARAVSSGAAKPAAASTFVFGLRPGGRRETS